MRAQPPPPDGSDISLRMTIEGAYHHTLCLLGNRSHGGGSPLPPLCCPVGCRCSAAMTRARAVRALRHRLPYHGWMTQKAFEVGLNAVPEWTDVRHVFAPSDTSFHEDVAAFVPASQRLLKRVHAQLTQLDLFDTRKSV